MEVAILGASVNRAAGRGMGSGTGERGDGGEEEGDAPM